MKVKTDPMFLDVIKRFQDYGMKLVPLNDETK